MSNFKRSLSLMACAAATAAIPFLSIQPADAEQRKSLRWMTSPIGSYGYASRQAQGINANPTMPVHPGLAKFLNEHNAWNDKWTVGASNN
jgi:hypothetical protein